MRRNNESLLPNLTKRCLELVALDGEKLGGQSATGFIGRCLARRDELKDENPLFYETLIAMAAEKGPDFAGGMLMAYALLKTQAELDKADA